MAEGKRTVYQGLSLPSLDSNSNASQKYHRRCFRPKKGLWTEADRNPELAESINALNERDREYVNSLFGGKEEEKKKKSKKKKSDEDDEEEEKPVKKSEGTKKKKKKNDEDE